MSFTIMYRKDGREVPIKMSIWDAFRGVPDQKPRRLNDSQCPCCGKAHAPAAGKSKDGSKDSRSKNELKTSCDSKEDSGKGNDSSSAYVEEFTAEDDATILKMKSENQTWNQILQTLGKSSKGRVHARFKELKKEEHADSHAKNDVDTRSDTKRARAGNVFHSNDRNDEKNTKADSSRATSSTGLRAWADGYDKKKWIAVASKHYDMTGQRITADQARKRAEAI